LPRHIFITLVVCQLLIAGCIPIAIPLPWFPEDPFKDGLEALEHQGAVHRDDIIFNWGKPWAAIDDSNLIYIREKPSSMIIVGFVGYGGTGSGDAGPMTHRDYVVSFNFDEKGMLKRFETYADTGNHNYCFENEVCFSEQTRNVPLSPEWMDKQAKQFHAATEECTLYLFRQPYQDGASYKEYVDIQLKHIPKYGLKYPFSIGSSVPGGYFRWQLQSGHSYLLTADFNVINSYPFTTHFNHKKRSATSIDVSCERGSIIYLGLVIPKKKKLPVELFVANPQSAQDSILQLKLLAGRYVPQL